MECIEAKNFECARFYEVAFTRGVRRLDLMQLFHLLERINIASQD
jgi:hypothetical protein